VDVTGRIAVGAGSNALRETLRGLTDAGKKKILVNLSECSYIDSSGIGELVSAFKEVTQEGGQLNLLGLSGHITYQLLITKSCTFLCTLMKALPSAAFNQTALPVKVKKRVPFARETYI
jgi:anti-sigma B factor antagonist